MLFALGAASSAIDALQALTSSKSPSAKSGNPVQGSPFDLSGGASTPTAIASGGQGGGSTISPQTMRALLAAQSQSSTDTATVAPKSRTDALKDLFAQIDGNGDGKITKTEFEDALGAGGTNLKNADNVFDKLDTDDDGSVSLDELMSALKGKGHRRAHHAQGANGDGANADPLMQALQGASTTSVTNSDGSVTTSLTYADGSKVTMTSAASGASSSAATSSYNFIERMIQRQAQAISASATAPLSVSA